MSYGGITEPRLGWKDPSQSGTHPSELEHELLQGSLSRLLLPQAYVVLGGRREGV